jgi:hypothetical protein
MKKIVVIFVLVGCVSVQCSAALLFRGGFENATKDGIATDGGSCTVDPTTTIQCSLPKQMEIVSKPVRSGKRAIRIYVDDDPPVPLWNKKERAELAIRGRSGGLGPYGSTRWIAWSVYIPKNGELRPDDIYSPPGAWFANSQLAYNVYDTSGKFVAGCAFFHLLGKNEKEGDARWHVEFGHGEKYTFGARTRGVWHDFLLEIKFHAENGKTRLKWRQGDAGPFETVVDHVGGNVRLSVLPVEKHEYYFKMGCYGNNKGNNGQRTMYFDGPWIGDDEAAVMGFFAADKPAPAAAGPAAAFVLPAAQAKGDTHNRR